MGSNNPIQTDLEDAIGYWIWVTITPVSVILGTFGNITSLLVLSRKKLFRTVSSTYLMSLAVVDLTMLYANALPAWVYMVMEKTEDSKYTVVCKLRRLQIHVMRDVSAWILVAITVERIIAMKFPHRYKVVCTRKSACIAVSAITALSFMVNSHFLVGYGVRPVPMYDGTVMETCAPVIDYSDFLKAWPIIHLVKACILPVVVMLSGSWVLLLELRRSRNQVLPSHSGLRTRPRIYFPAISRLLLGLNLLFISTTAPLFVYQSAYPSFYTYDHVPVFTRMRDPVMAVLVQLSYTNHVVNLILYCCTGSRFRAELRSMLCALKTRVCLAPRHQDAVQVFHLTPPRV